jgi:DNA-binding response OmpR family regulator
MSHHVLLVEDDPDARAMVARRLAHEGFACTAVETGHAALDAVRAQLFDAVLLDLGLPDMDGLEVLAGLRGGAPDLPVLMMTAQGAQPFVDLAEAHGATAYLVKPIGRTEMREALERAIAGT